MILLLSGEGPTDLGRCTLNQTLCDGNEFEIGPLTVIINKMIESELGYSLRDIAGSIRYVPKQALIEWISHQPKPRLEKSRSLKRESETKYFFNNAYALGQIALNQELIEQDTVIAILFRDADRTRSAPRQLWQTKHNSMLDGFASVPFLRGIPMLPRPKSEAWLLCAIKDPAYQHCQQLEELSGNDNALKPIKDQLEHILGEQLSRAILVQWIENNGFNWEAVSEQMPSFQSFTTRLNEILDQIIRPSREGSAQ